ncbi:MAG TPA: hypothetical protein VK358_17385 [Longimicrobium sp.]|nr:hypothetical protein [Longimicrobium sp.]
MAGTRGDWTAGDNNGVHLGAWPGWQTTASHAQTASAQKEYLMDFLRHHRLKPELQA